MLRIVVDGHFLLGGIVPFIDVFRELDTGTVHGGENNVDNFTVHIAELVDSVLGLGDAPLRDDPTQGVARTFHLANRHPSKD